MRITFLLLAQETCIPLEENNSNRRPIGSGLNGFRPLFLLKSNPSVDFIAIIGSVYMYHSLSKFSAKYIQRTPLHKADLLKIKPSKNKISKNSRK